jgi:hypothetical protein
MIKNTTRKSGSTRVFWIWKSFNSRSAFWEWWVFKRFRQNRGKRKSPQSAEFLHFGGFLVHHSGLEPETY